MLNLRTSHITYYYYGTMRKHPPGPDPLMHGGLSCQECVCVCVCVSSNISIRNAGALLTLHVASLICVEGNPFGCILRSLRGLQGLVGR